MKNIQSTDKNLRIDLFERIKSLEGKLCWAVNGGAGTGSIITLNFGNKILREEPLKNPFLSDEAQEFTAETSLMIYCVWRIDSENEVICSSDDSNEEDNTMVQGLKKIVGISIDQIGMKLPANDLEITFKNGLVLHVFCDITTTDSDNYVFYEDGYAFAVAAKGIITCES